MSLLLASGITETRQGTNYSIKSGPPNPKTLTPPIIVPPAAAFDYWQENKKWVMPRNINSDINQLDPQAWAAMNNDIFVAKKNPPNYSNEFFPKPNHMNKMRNQNATINDKRYASYFPMETSDIHQPVRKDNLIVFQGERDNRFKDPNSFNPQFINNQPIQQTFLNSAGNAIPQNIPSYGTFKPSTFGGGEGLDQLAGQGTFSNERIDGGGYSDQYDPSGMDISDEYDYTKEQPLNNLRENFKDEDLDNSNVQWNQKCNREWSNVPIEQGEFPDSAKYQRYDDRGGVYPYQGNFVNKQFYNITDENLNGVDDEVYYSPEQAQRGINLPTNLASSQAEQRMGDYNYEMFTQTLQPSIYTRSQVIEPINSLMGISFNPQFQEREQQVGGQGTEVTFTRLDPQLVRDNVPEDKRVEEPFRDNWTSKISAWDADSGMVNPEEINYDEIYDPRGTGYGDGDRSFVDMNLGQVKYYYSDIDAYRMPNFVIRSNVDHMDFHDPMGAVKPEYRREVLQENIRDQTNNKFHEDALFFREDLMERQMRKMNQRSWQLRARPLRQQGGMGGNRSTTRFN